MWGDRCEIAFSHLKKLLSSEPVLAFPDPNIPFILEAGASMYSVGGVLSQREEDGQIHPKMDRYILSCIFHGRYPQPNKNGPRTPKRLTR